MSQYVVRTFIDQRGELGQRPAAGRRMFPGLVRSLGIGFASLAGCDSDHFGIAKRTVIKIAAAEAIFLGIDAMHSKIYREKQDWNICRFLLLRFDEHGTSTPLACRRLIA